MAFAIVHFTVGFVSVLALLWLIPITRYRLTGAFLGGIWGLVPDGNKVFDGSRGERFDTLHDSSNADFFFFHSTLDKPFFREHNIELTFLAIVSLGIILLLYDWRFGRRSPSVRLFGSSTDDVDQDHDRL